MKLSVKQNMIIYALQQGWILITSSDSKEIWCCGEYGQFAFSRTLFYNLIDKDLIYQGTWEEHRYSFVLTQAGKEIKTKPVDLTPTQLYKSTP